MIIFPKPSNFYYLIHYLSFISKRLEEKRFETGEWHHILPKSLGGTNKKENLIFLSYEDHFIAHRLLWKIYGGKMAYAFFLMNHSRKTKINEKEYAKLREEYSKIAKTKKPYVWSEEHRKKARERLLGNIPWNKGKTYHKKKFDLHLSEETKQKISKAHKGKKQKLEDIEKRSKSNTGKIRSEECKKKISKANKGRIRTEATKNKIKENMKKLWQNEEYRNHQKMIHSRKIKETNNE